MVDYKKIYTTLCVAVSEALDALPDSKENAEGREILQTALFQAAELFISQADDSEV